MSEGIWSELFLSYQNHVIKKKIAAEIKNTKKVILDI